MTAYEALKIADAARFRTDLEKTVRPAGLLVEPANDRLGFLHRTFLEYWCCPHSSLMINCDSLNSPVPIPGSKGRLQGGATIRDRFRAIVLEVMTFSGDLR